jgi:hypothetical protein
VNHLVIKTNNLDATGFRLGGDVPNGYPDPEDVYNADHKNWAPGEGTNVIIGAVPQGIDVLVDSGSSGTFDRLVFGDNDTIVQQATVLSGAGNDLVNLQAPKLEGGEGDDNCDVLVDYLYAHSLGLGNILTIRSKGTAHLDNAPGTGAHREYVDRVAVSGENSANKGTLVVDHAATIDRLNTIAPNDPHPDGLLSGHWGDVTLRPTT